MKSKTVLFCTIVSFFAAVICISSVIKIPLGPVPLVFQNAMCILTGVLLGGVISALPILLFLVAGLLGLPVYSGGTSGIAVFLGPTGGFLIGYLCGAFVSGIIARHPNVYERLEGKNFIFKLQTVFRVILATVFGMIAIYVPGVIHFMRWTGDKFSKDTLMSVMSVCVFPYLLGDLIKTVIIILVAVKVRPVLAQYLNKNNSGSIKS